MLTSVVALVAERGYGQLSVAQVTSRARVSRRTFYELFENREACFVAAFDEAVAEMTRRAGEAYAGEREWREQIRAALATLLAYCDEQPGVAMLVIAGALGAGPAAIERRAQVLDTLYPVVDRGRAHGGRHPQPPALTAEGIVGAILSVVHARLVERHQQPLSELLNPLMAMILTPYLGHRAAAHEMSRSLPAAVHLPAAREDPLVDLPIRITYRTLRVLTVIAGQPGASNREVAEAAGVTDQGQMSRLMGRLERLGLVQNTGEGQLKGEANAWLLTSAGRRVQEATQARSGLVRKDTQTKGSN